MKRSEINAIIARAEADFHRIGFALPEFARWSPEDWRRRRAEAAAMIETGLGWDVTDFAEGRFDSKGLLLFTIRNGTLRGGTGNRPYAEKIMISRHDQLAPLHRHATKIEDIINRAALSPGAVLAIELFAMEEDGSPARQTKVTAFLDGRSTEVDAGTVVRLEPGASITLFPGTYHAFWGEGGDVVIGEVSSVNDDHTDNYFAQPLSRFPTIQEDQPIHRLTVTDYRVL
jgi:D-lyxose ketol-isomerase